MCVDYTRAYMLILTGKVPCCYVCVHRVILKLSFFFVAGVLMAGAGACSS